MQREDYFHTGPLASTFKKLIYNRQSVLAWKSLKGLAQVSLSFQ